MVSLCKPQFPTCKMGRLWPSVPGILSCFFVDLQLRLHFKAQASLVSCPGLGDWLQVEVEVRASGPNLHDGRALPHLAYPPPGGHLESKKNRSFYRGCGFGFCRQKVRGRKGWHLILPGDLGHLSSVVGACWGSPPPSPSSLFPLLS